MFYRKGNRIYRFDLSDGTSTLIATIKDSAGRDYYAVTSYEEGRTSDDDRWWTGLGFGGNNWIYSGTADFLGQVITVTQTAHPFANGDKVRIRCSSDTGYTDGSTNGAIKTISGCTTNTYQYTTTGVPTIHYPTITITKKDWLVVDLTTGFVTVRMECCDGVINNTADNVSVSPSGDYVIWGCSGGGHTSIYNRSDLSFIRDLFPEPSHADYVLGDDGDEYFVYYAATSGQIAQVGNKTGIARVNLRTGDHAMVLEQFSHWSFHISGICSRAHPGWVLISSYQDEDDTFYAFSSEVFFLNIHTGAVRRIAHHHCIHPPFYKYYFAEPQATCSWDASKVYVATDWGNYGVNVTLTAVGNMVTVHETSHPYTAGQTVNVYNASSLAFTDADNAAQFVISNVTTNTYDYTANYSTPPASGTATTGAGKIYVLEISGSFWTGLEASIIIPENIAGSEAFGQPRITNADLINDIIPDGISGGEAFGNPLLMIQVLGMTIFSEAINSGETFGNAASIFNGIKTATLAAPIDLEIEYSDEAFGDPAVQKLVSQAILVFESDSAIHHEVGFRSNLQREVTWAQEITHDLPTSGWGFDWGGNWGGPSGNLATPIRLAIPRDHARCQTLRTHYRHRTALEKVNLLELSLWFRSYSNRVSRKPK